MDTFANIELYKKEPVEDENGNPTLYNYLFFRDDKGRDWYETRESWKGAALACDASGMVCSVETDVTRMSMIEGYTVYEVKPEKVPDNAIGNYTYAKGKFKALTEGGIGSQSKEAVLADANNRIQTLQTIASVDKLSETEQAALSAWQKYVVELYRFDPSSGNEWPTPPA